MVNVYYTCVFVIAELSEVLWTMGFRAAFTTQGGLGVIAAFAMFTFWGGEFFFSLFSYQNAMHAAWRNSCLVD